MSKQEMLKGIDDYFRNTSKEEFLADLKELDCLDMVEDVEEVDHG